MAHRLLQLFGAYDLFGKSIPGSLLALGLLSLTKPGLLVNGSSSQNLPTIANIAVVLVAVLLIGLMIGQGVHTLADNIEKAFLWLARRSRTFVNLVSTGIRRLLIWCGVDATFRFDLENNPNDGTTTRFLKNTIQGVVEWFRRRFWGAYDSLVGHRRLFGKHFEWNYSGLDDGRRWEQGEMGRPYDRFTERYVAHFPEDVNPRQQPPEELVTRYPLVVTTLENSDITTHAPFQSIYSFCRSMWVVFVVLALLFMELLHGQLVRFRLCGHEMKIDLMTLPYEPLGAVVIPQALHPFVVPGLLISALVFFDASGTYKRHYVEYLVAGFASIETERYDETGESRDNGSRKKEGRGDGTENETPNE
jgi:hypothetical protein